MSVPVSFRWDEGLLARVDAARGDVSRSRWVVRAIEAWLGGERLVVPVMSRDEAVRAMTAPIVDELDGVVLPKVRESRPLAANRYADLPPLKRGSEIVAPEKLSAVQEVLRGVGVHRQLGGRSGAQT